MDIAHVCMRFLRCVQFLNLKYDFQNVLHLNKMNQVMSWNLPAVVRLEAGVSVIDELVNSPKQHTCVTIITV